VGKVRAKDGKGAGKVKGKERVKIGIVKEQAWKVEEMKRDGRDKCAR